MFKDIILKGLSDRNLINCLLFTYGESVLNSSDITLSAVSGSALMFEKVAAFILVEKLSPRTWLNDISQVFKICVVRSLIMYGEK